MGKAGTCCNWRVILYPESLKPNWLSILKASLIQFAVSPLHDLDVWTEEDQHFDPLVHVVGELKKPHYHVVAHFGGPKTIQYVRPLFDQLISVSPEFERESNGHANIIPAFDLGQAVRYLVHYDNDRTKHHYDQASIQSFNGFDVNKFFKLTKDQEADLTRSIRAFIRNNKIFEYSVLLDELGDVTEDDPRFYEYNEMYIYCLKHTILLNSYVRSFKFTKMPNMDQLPLSDLPFED